MTTINGVNTSLSGQTGTGTFVGSTSPTLVTPVLGVASATSINFGGSALSTYVADTSWTPIFTFATPGDLSVVYSVQQGYYTTIGAITFMNFSIACTPTFTTSSGVFEITGQPVTASFRNSVGGIYTGAVTFSAGYTNINVVAQSTTNYLIIEQSGTTAAAASMTTANFVSGTPITLLGSVAVFHS